LDGSLTPMIVCIEAFDHCRPVLCVELGNIKSSGEGGLDERMKKMGYLYARTSGA
jgi:hypothetical protein